MTHKMTLDLSNQANQCKVYQKQQQQQQHVKKMLKTKSRNLYIIELSE